MKNKLLTHKIFFHEEFFGSRIYNTKSKEEYFFDQNYTAAIKKILSGDYENKLTLNNLQRDLAKKGLLTSDIVHIKNRAEGEASSLLYYRFTRSKCTNKFVHFSLATDN